MTRIRSIVAILSIALLLTMGSSTAQIQVFDPSNYAQNLQTAANTLKQINNQLTALQNQTQMLLNQAKHLVSLPTSLVSAIDQTFTQTQNILRNVDRIAYDVQAIGQAFASYQHFNASQSDQQLIALAHGIDHGIRGLILCLEHHIGLERLTNVRLQIEGRQLQQPNGLLQLRRHRELLADAKLQTWLQHSSFRSKPTV